VKADICFIGGGLNYAGAVIASKASLKTVLIEKDMNMLGGTCLHKGCIPSKTFLHFASVLRESGREVFSKSAVLDMKKLLDKKNLIVEKALKAITAQCKGVNLIEAEGKVVYRNRVVAGDMEIEAKYVIIGTGSAPFVPEGIEYDGEHIITSDEVLNMESLPEEIFIYGNGAIGLEMASFFSSVGVKTTLVYRREKLFSKAHPLINASLEEMMKNSGVILKPSSSVKRAKFEKEKGKVFVEFEEGGVMTQKLLVATGRRAVTSAVSTEEIKLGAKGIEVDEIFETSLKNHFAIGDCNGKLQLAHAARAEVLNVVNRILGKNPSVLDLSKTVKFVHTLPMSYATVGFTKAELERTGSEYKESVVPLKSFTYPAIHESEEGFVILYADREGFVLGGEILSKDAEELIGIVSMALAGEMDAKLARKTILAHPTFSESVEKGFYRL